MAGGDKHVLYSVDLNRVDLHHLGAQLQGWFSNKHSNAAPKATDYIVQTGA